jgi:hypothetical protein
MVDGNKVFHFTYCAPEGNDLRQGDILLKTNAISEILKEVHPHYQKKDDYTHFIVLTQSCDLVRRDDKLCKAKYISIATIRPFQLVLEREIAKHQDKFASDAGVCSVKFKSLLEQFVKRILNNNEPEYFYLEQEPIFQIYEPSCAFLRLSIALRADHYGCLFDARTLSLRDIFQAKLGWLIGNIYSRIGTEDWVPDYVSQEDFDKKTNQILEEVVQWVNHNQLSVAKKSFSGESLDRETIRKHIEDTPIPNKKENVIKAVIIAF